jgi:two-component system sensor histidine kinase QseC
VRVAELRRRFDSLAARLILMVLCATLLAWLVFSLALYYEMRQQVGKQQSRQLAAYADMLWQSLGDDDDLQPPAESKSAKPGKPGVLAYALYRPDGSLLAASGLPALPLPPAAGERTRHFGEPWIVAVRQDEARRLVVGEPLHRQEEIAEEVLETLVLPLVVILLLLLPVLAVAIHRGLKPLRDVDAELLRRAPDNLDPIDLPAPREIAPLLQRLNALFGQLGATLERERRFTADAAHELRTPLAALRVQIEIAQGSPRPLARQKAFANMLVGLDRITHLLGQLLDLARLDHARLPRGERLDLPALARQALLDADLPDTEGRLQVRNARVCRGHSGLISLLLRNLLDNARRYAGPEAMIGVEIDGLSLTVADDGPGVDPDVLAHLGERFYRPPGQRQSGAGLGVSIARRVAELHGGRLILANLPGGGFQASLLLPEQ